MSRRTSTLTRPWVLAGAAALAFGCSSSSTHGTSDGGAGGPGGGPVGIGHRRQYLFESGHNGTRIPRWTPSPSDSRSPGPGPHRVHAPRRAVDRLAEIPSSATLHRQRHGLHATFTQPAPIITSARCTARLCRVRSSCSRSDGPRRASFALHGPGAPVRGRAPCWRARRMLQRSTRHRAGAAGRRRRRSPSITSRTCRPP